MPTVTVRPIPIYYRNQIPATAINAPTAFLVSYELAQCWQIIDTNTGCIYTPQAFEAKFGTLPPCPPSATRKTRKLWTKHQRQPPKNNPSRGRRGER